VSHVTVSGVFLGKGTAVTRVKLSKDVKCQQSKPCQKCTTCQTLNVNCQNVNCQMSSIRKGKCQMSTMSQMSQLSNVNNFRTVKKNKHFTCHISNDKCQMSNAKCPACMSKQSNASEAMPWTKINNYKVINNRGRAGFILENFPFSNVFTLHILSTCWEIIGFYKCSHVFGKEIMAVEPPTQLTG
jgi:hypothetical protein